MRPPDQNGKGVRSDCKHLLRIHERARNNTSRPKEINDEIDRLLARLVMLYTQETVGPMAGQPEPSPPTNIASARPNGKRRLA